MIKAPFNPDIIERFNAYQNSKIFHPYTCGNCSNSILKIKESGLYCEHCDYTQDKITILPEKNELQDNIDFFKTVFNKKDVE